MTDEVSLDALAHAVENLARQSRLKSYVLMAMALLMGVLIIVVVLSLAIAANSKADAKRSACRAQVVQEWNDLVEGVIVGAADKDPQLEERSVKALKDRPSQGDLIKERCK